MSVLFRLRLNENRATKQKGPVLTEKGLCTLNTTDPGTELIRGLNPNGFKTNFEL